LLDRGVVKGLAHITGGGLTDNIPRILPPGTSVKIDKDSWTTPPLFQLLRRLGNVSEPEMNRTFNMGIGMVIVCSRGDAGAIKTHLGETCYEIGEVVSGNGEVLI
jgi:phosphoribosylformylglycinamidine cyclo-ligase